jgi:hypothetical protein
MADVGHWEGDTLSQWLILANIAHREGETLSQWLLSAIGRVYLSPNGAYWPLGGRYTLPMGDIGLWDGASPS